MLQIQNAGRFLIYLANGEKQNLEFTKFNSWSSTF